MKNVETLPKRPVPARLAQEAENDVDHLMRDLLDQAPKGDRKAEALADGKGLKETSQPRRNTDTAFDIIDRASQAFDVLISRYHDLEQETRDLVARASAERAESVESIEQWKQLALRLKDQFKAADQKLEMLSLRHEQAEARAVKAERQLKELEISSAQAAERASQAEELSTRIHDKVVSTFGIGSRMHPLFDAVTSMRI